MTNTVISNYKRHESITSNTTDLDNRLNENLILQLANLPIPSIGLNLVLNPL